MSWPLNRIKRVVRAGDALSGPIVYALQDPGDPEQVVGEIKIPMLDSGATRTFAITGDVLLFGRNAECIVVESQDSAEPARCNAPAHAVITEVGQRMAKGGKLPIDDGDDARFARIE